MYMMTANLELVDGVTRGTLAFVLFQPKCFSFWPVLSAAAPCATAAKEQFGASDSTLKLRAVRVM